MSKLPYLGLSEDHKREIKDFYEKYMVCSYDLEAVYLEAEQSILFTDLGCMIYIEIPAYNSKTQKLETLHLGCSNDFYEVI